MKRGLDPNTFWNMSHKEVIVYLKAVDKKLEEEIKVQAGHNYKLALMFNHAYGGNLRPISSYYEGLFDEELKQKQDWRKSKANVLKFLNQQGR